MVQRSCKSGDITFLICRVTRYWSVMWLCGWGPLILSHHLLSLGVIGLMEREIMAFVISVPISIPVPIPRFPCRGLRMALFIFAFIKIIVDHFHRKWAIDVSTLNFEFVLTLIYYCQTEVILTLKYGHIFNVNIKTKIYQAL